MKYYGVEVILYVRFKDGSQPFYPVWVNIYVTAGVDREDAMQRAECYARTFAGVEITCNDRPAELLFGGVRSNCEILDATEANLSVDSPTEVFSYQLDVQDDHALQELINGDEVLVTRNSVEDAW